MNNSTAIWIQTPEYGTQEPPRFRPRAVTIESLKFMDVLEAGHQTMSPGRYLLLLREHRARSMRRAYATGVSTRA